MTASPVPSYESLVYVKKNADRKRKNKRKKQRKKMDKTQS